MKLIRGINIGGFERGCVATIGAFDALHIGHQAIIQRIKVLAKRLQLPAVLLMFEPLPSEIFVAENEIPTRIYSFRQRLEIAQSLGLDCVVCLRFTSSLARWTADEFINRIAVNGLQVRQLVVGDDFRFGKDRQGDFKTLCTYGEHYGFGVEKIPTVAHAGVRVSSTRIRQLLLATEITQANQLLGREYKVSGRICIGDKRGTKIGYPTANLMFHHQRPPLYGVYAVELAVPGGARLAGVANAGLRPTVDGQQYRIETYLFDFDEDLYGKRVEIYPRHYIRSEQKYTSIAELKGAIANDVQFAQRWFVGLGKSVGGSI